MFKYIRKYKLSNLQSIFNRLFETCRELSRTFKEFHG